MIRYFEITNPGNSGSSIQLVVKDKGFSVRKTSKTREYNQRLRLQKIKQQQFAKSLPKGIIVPEVTRYGVNWYEMEYVSMLDSISFFERASPEIINNRIQLLLSFIDTCLSQSQTMPLGKRVIFGKISNIKKATDKIVWKKYFAKFEEKITDMCPDNLIIPLGSCHGDLTFSNVLFSLDEEKLCLIDFLDSFVESPLVDIIKLRQDTKFHWTNNRYPNKHDVAKIRIIDNWLDEMVVGRYKKFLNIPGYKILEAVNYLRIVPYTSKKEDLEFLDTALADVMKMK